MKKQTKTALWLLAAAVVALVGFVLLTVDSGGRDNPSADDPEEKPMMIPSANPPGNPPAANPPKPPPEGDSADIAPDETESTDPEERADRLVDEFDELTDKWMEPTKEGVTMKDVEAYVAKFKTVPKDRQDECLQRALNLVPDENVMLLVGILMDKSLGKENLETVFNDILNRDETVKEPILKMVFKDKTHPCWTDTAWILDVTRSGEEK